MTSPVAPPDPTEPQRLSTGTLGALFLLMLVLSHGVGRPQRGPGWGFVSDPFPWLVGCHLPAVSQEFFDLVGILAVGFVFMACWELARSGRVRALLLGAALAGVLDAWHVALGGAGTLSSPAVLLSGGRLTREEGLLLSVALLLLGIMAASGLPRLPAATIDPGRLRRALRTAAWRWGAGLIAFWCVLAVALHHPYYQDAPFANWRSLCALLLSVYLFAGLPYAVLTCYHRTGLSDDVRDPGFMLLLAIRRVWRWALLPRSWRRSWPGLRRVLWNRRSGLVARDLLVKVFFAPVMTLFFFANCTDLFGALSPSPATLSMGEGAPMHACVPATVWYPLVFHSLMLADVALGLIGYLCASRWLGNKSVSVEPTGLGWAAALACYPPFNGVSLLLLPYPSAPPGAHPLMDLLGRGALTQGLEAMLQIVALLGYALYAASTMAFGLRFSNLTHRGVIDRGPYAIVRHPAYVGKNIAWWAENLRSFASPWQLLFLAGWNAIYLARALTEERHLQADPRYRAYCERVRYRFIPGWF